MTEGIVFHYTTIPALFGIVTKRELYLSDVRMLNDPTELHLGLRYLRDLVADKIKQKKDVPTIYLQMLIDEVSSNTHRYGSLDDRTFVKWLEGLPQEVIAGYDMNVPSNPNKAFVFSCSRQRDKLDLWRPYGDDANGVMIAIDKDKLKKALQEHSGLTDNVAWVNMRYDKTELCNELSKDLDAILNMYMSMEETNPDTPLHEPYSNLARRLVSKKHRAYKSEKEIRLHVNQSVRPLRVESDSGIRLEYVNSQTSVHRRLVLSLGSDLKPIIASVLLGPKHKGRATETMVREFLCDNGIEAVVSTSKVPYR
ncbi:MAG: DUF2971 domain-containing protein [Ignavibacteria bacterium]|nr:DUF2971 domain-containing protein [Ignavibacteria bacterium]MBK7411508.1 DUF2971 domain-containing protein [Ignavibacteria bacterium]MBK7577743.1 DUF2971 domain-containing protein [Ignavibacteria bacterium]MBK9183651.1 DUF2971 domain-containing protein [Ignavibacteria bacterium]